MKRPGFRPSRGGAACSSLWEQMKAAEKCGYVELKLDAHGRWTYRVTPKGLAALRSNGEQGRDLATRAGQAAKAATKGDMPHHPGSM